MRQSGFILALLGAAGLVFLWLTDPRYGLFPGAPDTLIDRAHDSTIGTIVGIITLVIVIFMGLWLATRRKI